MNLHRIALSFCSMAAAMSVSAADITLFDFRRDIDLAQIKGTDATVALTGAGQGRALKVNTGHTQPWPGITLAGPSGGWDLSRANFVVVQVRNPGEKQVTVCCRVDNPGADGVKNCVSGTSTVKPGQMSTIRVELKRAKDDTLGGRLFGMRGYPVKAGAPGTIDPAAINQLVVFVPNPKEDHRFEILRASATGAYTPPTAWVTDADPFFPLIDSFGQYRHKDWPGKTHSLKELLQRRQVEQGQLASNHSVKDWDQYGGWNGGPRLYASGYFRVEKYRGKWWLVDPEGRLFFSHGIDCVRMFDATPIAGRESWFEDFPGNQPEFKNFIIPESYALKGYYAGQRPQCFSFARANLLRKYGPDWQASTAATIHQRLRAWGLNTIGMWSDARIRLMHQTPYVDALGSRRAKMLEGSEGYWGKFPDVFDPGFEQGLRQDMASKTNSSGIDPWCIGFFADNEMSWGDEVSLALAALTSPPDQPAKKVFVADLKTAYAEVEKLNAAWGTTYASWDALLESRSPPDRQRAWKDLTTFYSKSADQYFRTVRDTIKKMAPNHLYLGCRFAWVNPRAAASAARFCDIVSYNLYRRSVADFQFNGGADVPLIIGEFHLGALDRGMFHTGLVPVANQDERARCYKEYVEGALRHPSFVGCHWFQYQDEPTTGRVYDEENYQIGFVDIADTPYRETVAAARAVAEQLYRVRLGD